MNKHRPEDFKRPGEAQFAWNSPVEKIGKLGAGRIRSLLKLGIKTVGDLLLAIPLRYENRSKFSPFPPAAAPGPILLCGRVVDMLPDKFLPGKKRLTEVQIEPYDVSAPLLTEPVSLKWLNARHIRSQIAVGHQLVVFGLLQQKGRTWSIWFPEFEVIEQDQNELGKIHLGRIVPVHSSGAGITPRFLRELVWEALEGVVPDSAPPPIWGLDNGVFRTPLDRFRALHFPKSEAEANAARLSLERDEALAVQTALLMRRARNRKVGSPSRAGEGKLVKEFIKSLPYPLTTAQQRVLEEIMADLRASHPMTRLLHGDVGSGKTVIAFCAMLAAVESGWQAALMAPTQVLAEQHYANGVAFLESLGVRIGLRTGSRSFDTNLPLFNEGASGEPDIFIGTHALLYEDNLPRLGLVVVDEQHKFGVVQRARLAEMGSRPDFLVMTATPIPRTLSLTIYGDLDVSVLDELPPGRRPVKTVIRNKNELDRFVVFLKSELSAGRQAYLVFPLIEDSDKVDARAAKREFEHWAQVLQPHSCGLMHGKLKPAEKKAVMDRFRLGKISALVSTMVIEVGVDVPNATVMVIFDAERFGLAQLHQLRGRVGRGGLSSYCVLVPSKNDRGTLERLAVLEATSDGFKLAEADLAFRGAGRLFGTAQSGDVGFRMLDPCRSVDLLSAARTRAAEILEVDPALSLEENSPLAEAVKRLPLDQSDLATGLISGC